MKWVDGVQVPEDSIGAYHSGVEDPGMMHKVQVATRETHAALQQRSMANHAENRGSQMTTWESDTAIVPKIASNPKMVST